MRKCRGIITRNMPASKIDSPCLGGFERWQHHAPFPQGTRASSRRQRVSVAFRAHHQPCLCRKWVIRGDFGGNETAMSSELIRWTQFSPSVRTRLSPAFARRFRPRNLARPCKRDSSSSCDCRARWSPIPALGGVLTCVTRALRSGTRTKKQTAVARGPKRIVFTNFLVFELKTWHQALFFISQREAGRPTPTNSFGLKRAVFCGSLPKHSSF